MRSGHPSPPSPARASEPGMKEEQFRAGRRPHFPAPLGHSPHGQTEDLVITSPELASRFEAPPSLTPPCPVLLASSSHTPAPAFLTVLASAISSPESDHSHQRLSSL